MLAAMSDELKRIARLEIEEIFSKGNLDLVDEIVSPEYVIFDNGRAEPVRGRENLKAAVRAMRSAVSDFVVTVDEQLAEGDTVMTRWRATGTHTGTLFGLAPTGRPITMHGIDIERFDDGQFAEVHSVWDTYAVLRQIGAVDIDIDV
jgi:steroid delta-isomerase-like uncharacterized protein